MSTTHLAYGDLTLYGEDQRLLLNRYQLEEHLYQFTKAAWKHIDPAPFRPGWPIEAIAEHLEAVVDGQITRLIINIPPRSGKSTLCSVCFPAWVWAQPPEHDSATSGPGVQFVFASYAEKLSLRFSLRNRRLINTRWYQRRWGSQAPDATPDPSNKTALHPDGQPRGRFRLLTDENTAHRFANDVGGERLVTSIGGTATGFGGNIFVIDDANATNEANSEAAIEEVIEWWDQTASTRLNDIDAGAFINIQQRVAENDLTGHVLEKSIGDWDTVILPMHFDPQRYYTSSIGWADPRYAPEQPNLGEGTLLWPERFPDRAVRALEQTLGPWGAAGQLEQSPKPKGGGIIQYSWWNAWEEAHYPPMDFILASLDTAYTEKTENDFSALTIWGIFSHGTTATPGRYIDHDGRPVYIAARNFYEPSPKVMLMHAWQRRLALHELVTSVADTCKRMKVDLLLIENKASGISVSQEMQRLYADEPWGVELNDPKSLDKVSRLHSVVPFFAPELREQRDQQGRILRNQDGTPVMVPIKDGIVYAPSLPGMPTFRVWAEEVIRQVESFPKGKHDDFVDTVSQALRHLRDRGLLKLGAERLAEIEQAKQYSPPPEPLYPGVG